MHVLMSTDTVGGVWTYAVTLAEATAPLGVRYTLVTMGAPLTTDQRRQIDRLSNVRLVETSFKLEWMESSWDDVRQAGDRLLALEQELHPDLVHLNGYAHGQWRFTAPTLVVGHSCVLSWWEAVKGEPAPQNWKRYHSEVWAGLHGVSTIVAPSHAMRDALQRHYGPLSDVRVIYNGRNADSLLKPAAVKEPFILAAGRVWDEAKNIHALDHVAPALPWPVYVAGESQHPDNGQRQAANLKMLGKLDASAMAGWFGRAGIYCLPAKYEPFGLSILEAALAGCALVLGDIPSLREIWGDAAVYVKPDDEASIERALLKLIDDPAMRQRLALAASERASRYSTAAHARAYVRLYRELADLNSPSAIQDEPKRDHLTTSSATAVFENLSQSAIAARSIAS